MIFVFAAMGWKGVSYDGYQYPAWAEAMGWILVMLTAMWIPIFAIKSIRERTGTFFEVTSIFILFFHM